jgi:hypothetical protein
MMMSEDLSGWSFFSYFNLYSRLSHVFNYENMRIITRTTTVTAAEERFLRSFFDPEKYKISSLPEKMIYARHTQH